jgi:hypothetical protein
MGESCGRLLDQAFRFQNAHASAADFSAAQTFPSFQSGGMFRPPLAETVRLSEASLSVDTGDHVNPDRFVQRSSYSL